MENTTNNLENNVEEINQEQNVLVETNEEINNFETFVNEEPSTYVQETPAPMARKKKNPFIIAASIVAVLLILGGCMVAFAGNMVVKTFMGNKAYFFMVQKDSFFMKKVENAGDLKISKMYNNYNASFKVNDITMSALSKEQIDFIKKTKLSFTVSNNKKDKSFSVNSIINISGTDALTLNASLTKDNIIIGSKEILSQNLYMKKGYDSQIDKLLNSVNSSFENNSGDLGLQYKKAYSELDNAFKNNVKNSDIVNADNVIFKSLSGDVKCNSSILTLNEKDFKVVSKALVKVLIENNKKMSSNPADPFTNLANSAFKLYGIKAFDLENSIDEINKQIDTAKTGNVKITVYFTGNVMFKHEVIGYVLDADKTNIEISNIKHGDKTTLAIGGTSEGKKGSIMSNYKITNGIITGDVVTSGEVNSLLNNLNSDTTIKYSFNTKDMTSIGLYTGFVSISTKGNNVANYKMEIAKAGTATNFNYIFDISEFKLNMTMGYEASQKDVPSLTLDKTKDIDMSSDQLATVAPEAMEKLIAIVTKFNIPMSGLPLDALIA
jgi:hypothetical protein